jgi:cysteine desulfurase / selenocysteine lyase
MTTSDPGRGKVNGNGNGKVNGVGHGKDSHAIDRDVADGLSNSGNSLYRANNPSHGAINPINGAPDPFNGGGNPINGAINPINGTRNPLNGAIDPLTGSIPSGMPGMLDISALTRLANEFMTAIPGSSESGENLFPGNEQARAARSFNGLEGSTNLLLPNEAELRQLPAAIAGTTGAPVPVGTVSPLSTPGMPGGFSLAQVPSVPFAFSFLEEIRSLTPQSGNLSSPESAVPELRNASNASQFLPNNGNFDRTTTGLMAPQLPGVLAMTDLSSPQIPGAVMRPDAAFGRTSFDFQEQSQQIFGVDVVPTLEPYGLHQTGLSNLNFGSGQFDIDAIRRDFPILQEQINGHQLIWLDNAATTQKPQSVIDRLSHFYSHENSNVHRAAHELAARSTDAYEAARESVRRFLNASSVNEIVFVRGATEAINLVAQSWGRQNIQKDDEILITWLEHHANIVPWQMLCAEKGARLRVAPVDDHGQIILEEYERLLGPRTRLVSFAQVSNALGTITPVDEMVAAAHRYGAKVLVDGAQAVSHMHVDVQEYDCDFYVFSGHKIFAPTGIGVLYGKSDLLNAMRPWQGGGNMIQDVTFEKTVYQSAPLRFEAGTGSIADAVGLGAAIDYLERIGMHNINRYENDLMKYATEALKSIPGLHLIGTAPHKAGVLSFVLDGFRTEEISSVLNQQGIAVRAGHHCAQPILRRFGVESTVRPSLALYNTCEEIDALIAAIWNLKQGRGPGPL